MKAGIHSVKVSAAQPGKQQSAVGTGKERESLGKKKRVLAQLVTILTLIPRLENQSNRLAAWVVTDCSDNFMHPRVFLTDRMPGGSYSLGSQDGGAESVCREQRFLLDRKTNKQCLSLFDWQIKWVVRQRRRHQSETRLLEFHLERIVALWLWTLSSWTACPRHFGKGFSNARTLKFHQEREAVGQSKWGSQQSRSFYPHALPLLSFVAFDGHVMSSSRPSETQSDQGSFKVGPVLSSSSFALCDSKHRTLSISGHSLRARFEAKCSGLVFNCITSRAPQPSQARPSV